MRIDKEYALRNLEKILYFIIIIAFALGVIGGLGYLFYDHHILFGIADIVVVALAFPLFIKVFKEFLK